MLGAAFRQNNWMVSLATMDYQTRENDPTYNVLSDIEGTKFFDEYADEFVGSRSKDETSFIKSKIERRERDLHTLQSGGWFGTVAGMGAGLIDPLILAPGGAIVRSGKAGVSLLKSGASVAAANLAAAGAYEGLIRLSQPERTTQETLFNIGTATIIGGVLGAGASRFVSAAERRAAEKAFDDFTARQKGTPTGGGQGGSIGAAVTDTRELTPVGMGTAGKVYGKISDTFAAGTDLVRKVPVVGKPVGAVLDAVGTVAGSPAALVRNIGPTNRIAYNSFATAKRAMFDLADSAGVLFERNLEGLPTTSQGGPSIETHALLAIQGGRYRMARELDGLWKDYYWGDAKKRLGQVSAKVAEFTGRAEAGRLSFEQFKREVGKALRRNDEHDIAQVAAAAKQLRADIFEPWKKLAIDLKLLPEDVSVDQTAASYLMRLYDKPAIVARRPEFEGTISKWLAGEQAHNAGVKTSLTAAMAERKIKEAQLRRLEGRIATANRRVDAVETRLSERGLEATATERRADTVMDRQAEAKAAVQDIKDFIVELKDSGDAPVLREAIRDLEREAADLESGAAAITEKDLAAVDKATRQGILVGPMRRVGRIMTGKGKMPKGVEPFWKHVKRLILSNPEAYLEKDARADLLKLARRPKDDGEWILRDAGIQWDIVQGKLAEDFGDLRAMGWGTEQGGLTNSFDNEIRDMLDLSQKGTEPAWYRSARGSQDDEMIVGMVNELTRMQDEGLVPQFKSMDDFADFFSGRDAGMTEADYDKIMADIDQSSANMDARVAAIDVSNMADIRRESLDLFKQSMAAARQNLASVRKVEGKAGAKVQEATVAATRNMRRIDVLDRRSRLAETQAELLGIAKSNLEKEIIDIRTRMEADIGKWRGKSTSEATAALDARTEAERIRGLKIEAGIYGGKNARLASADNSVDKAVARIMASDKDLADAELQGLAVEIVDRILGTPDGRLPYDAPTGGSKTGIPTEGPPPRGPLAHRSFMIPDELIEDFLVSDVEEVANAYLQTMVPDLLITQKFGDVDMTEAFKQVRDEHTAKRQGITDPKVLKKLDSEYRSAVVDLAGVRDRLRGTYGATWGMASNKAMQNAGRVAQSLTSFSVLTDMGGSAISQLTDLTAPVMRYGFEKVFNDGYQPFLRGLMEKDGGAFGEAAEQYRALGVGIEMATSFKPLMEVGEEFSATTKTERALRAGAGYYMMANLSAPITAKAKSIAAVVAGNEVIRAAKASISGKATPQQLRMLGDISVTPDLAQRISDQFDKGGAIKDGVYLPNTADWTDDAARLAFEGAIMHETNITVVTPGQERPLILSNPIIRPLTQFKSFTGASTTRILLANLQRRDAAVLQGLIAQVGMGMIGYKAYSIAAGREPSERPQDWIKEGISRSGILGWLDEGNTIVAKATGGQADAYRIIGADKPLSKYASKNTISSLLGPSVGKAELAIRVLYGVSNGDIKESDIHALRRIMPVQNLFYIRGLLDDVDKAVGSAVEGALN